MADGNSKKKRTPLKSRGEGSTMRTKKGAKVQGSKKNPQDQQALIMMRKGRFAALKPAPGPTFSNAGGGIYDKVQSEINKKLGYW